MTARRRRTTVAALAGAAAVIVTSVLAGAALVSDRGAPRQDEVALAPIVAAWPDSYSVTGGKSEPLYTERIAIDRDGSAFHLSIEVLGQGDAALGRQESAVEVAPDGRVVWLTGCVKSSVLCADDTTLRGFLATAAVAGLERRGRLPATGVLRELHGRDLVCVADADLHPDAPRATVRLDPCFDLATGAALAHWSPASAAFVGATLAPDALVTTHS